MSGIEIIGSIETHIVDKLPLELFAKRPGLGEGGDDEC